jgi:hypothetical protein
VFVTVCGIVMCVYVKVCVRERERERDLCEILLVKYFVFILSSRLVVSGIVYRLR